MVMTNEIHRFIVRMDEDDNSEQMCVTYDDHLAAMQAKDDRIAELEAERDAALAGAVKVKPLAWEDADDGMCTKWRALALGGRYDLVALDKEDGLLSVMFHWGRPLSFWFIQGCPDEFGMPSGPKKFPTLDAAKAAAQADYEARILAAIQPDTEAVDMAEAAAFSAGFDAGQRDEREACAMEADKRGWPGTMSAEQYSALSPTLDAEMDCGSAIAAAIRKRGEGNT